MEPIVEEHAAEQIIPEFDRLPSVTARHLSPAGLWAALLILAGVVLLRGPALQTDLLQFLPEGNDQQQRFLLDELQQGPASRLIIAALSGGEAEKLATTSNRMLDLLAAKGEFGRVLNGPFTATASAEPLFGYRYLLTDTAARLDSAGLHHALEERLEEITSQSSAFLVDNRNVSADPVAAGRELARNLRGGQQGPHLHHGVWFTPEGDKALLLITMADDTLDLDGQHAAVQRIRTAFEDSAESGQRLELTGPAVFAVESKRLISSETRRLSLLAGGGVLLLLLAVYRSAPVVILGVLPLATGLLAGAAAVTLSFGSLHGITLAFGFSLVGVAVDYPIHLFSYARETGTTASAARRLWPTLRLGVFTTALGYSALLFSGFSALSQLGVFAITGLLAAVATTRWVLPTLGPTLPSVTSHRAERLFAHMNGRAGWLPPLLLVVGVLTLAGSDTVWERDLSALSPLSEEGKQLDRRLRNAIGAPDVRHLLLIERGSTQDVLESAERLEEALEELVSDGALQGFELPSHYLPSIARQEARQQQLPEASKLKRWIEKATEDLPFRRGLFSPFANDVDASRSLPPLLPAMLDGSPLGERLQALLRTYEGQTVGLITLSGVKTPEAVAAFAVTTPGLTHLDLSVEAARLIGGYRDEALGLFAIGALIIVGVLFAALRRPGAVVRVMTPTAAAIVMSAALLVAGGTPLSLFHLSSLLLLLGIGLDYGLFYERLRTDAAERRATATALLVCNMTTVLVFGALAGSAVPVLKAIGATVAIGAPLSLIFTALMAHNSPSRDKVVTATSRR
ncbi:MMPL family transporter [Thiohalomonas denitrificans]|uniref:MMPL family transporter n=1 Tax=Thiohalomonas denitrificans TaxID=415747 RepID=UPI0026F21B66|nr:MMPL family transporter [Thiohalomonas denitrificans]